jgi:hypothetical protein
VMPKRTVDISAGTPNPAILFKQKCMTGVCPACVKTRFLV